MIIRIQFIINLIKDVKVNSLYPEHEAKLTASPNLKQELFLKCDALSSSRGWQDPFEQQLGGIRLEQRASVLSCALEPTELLLVLTVTAKYWEWVWPK